MRLLKHHLFGILSCFIPCLPLQLEAATFSTVSSGVWGSPGVWANNLIPPLAGGDTVYIRHYIMFSSSINLATSTYMRIDTMGTLCGHQRFFVPGGSSIDNYGELYADSLIINGGDVTNYNFIHMANMAMVTNGGSFQNAGGSMVVGNSFLCGEKSNGIADREDEGYFLVYPLPVRAGEEIHIKNLPATCTVQIYSLTGQLLYETKTARGEGIRLASLDAGTYFIQAFMADELLFRKKLIVIE